MRQEKQTATAEPTATITGITIIRRSEKVVCHMREDNKKFNNESRMPYND